MMHEYARYSCKAVCFLIEKKKQQQTISEQTDVRIAQDGHRDECNPTSKCGYLHYKFATPGKSSATVFLTVEMQERMNQMLMAAQSRWFVLLHLLSGNGAHELGEESSKY